MTQPRTMTQPKTSTFVVHHDRCKPEEWRPCDVLLLAEFIRTGNLAVAARLSRLGVQLVASERHTVVGGTLEEIGFAVAGEDTTEVWPLDAVMDFCDEDVAQVHRIYRGPVEYVARIGVGGENGEFEGWEYEVRATEEEARKCLPSEEDA